MTYGIIIQIPEAPVTEEWSWETDMSVSYNGTEDRIPLLRYPHRTFSGTFQFLDADSLRRYIAMATKRFRTEFSFPLFHYQTKLKASVAAGADTIAVNARRSNLRVGATALIIEGDTFEEIEVASVTATSVEFATPLENDYSMRATVCPVVTVYSNSNSSVSRMAADHAATSSFTFIERLPTVPFVTPLNGAVLEEFEGFPILPFVPTGPQYQSTVTTGLRTVDYSAIDDLISPWVFEQWNYSYTFLISHIAHKENVADRFPILYNNVDPTYPQPGEFYPLVARVGPYNSHVRLVAGNSVGWTYSGTCRPDEKLYLDGVTTGASYQEYAAGHEFAYLFAGQTLRVEVQNVTQSGCGIEGVLSVEEVPNIEWWQAFADRIQGAANPFLFPTNRDDFHLITPAAPSGDKITVKGDEYTQHYWGHGGFSRIFIDSDAGRHYARITAISAISGNDRLTFEPPLPSDLAWGTNQRVGFLLKVRLASDRIALTHYGASSEVAVSLRTVI